MYPPRYAYLPPLRTSSHTTWKNIVILDDGSFSTKFCIFPKDSDPSPSSSTHILRSVVGRQRHPFAATIGRTDPPHAYVGHEVRDYGIRYTRVNYPYTLGVATNFDDLEMVWHHAFYQVLQTDPQECVLFLTEPILQLVATRERLTQIIFEIFYFNGVLIRNEQLLVLDALDVSDGIVLDSGHQLTKIVPIRSNTIIPHLVKTLAIGGHNLSEKFKEYLKVSYSELLLNRFKVDSIVTEIKEILSSVNTIENNLSVDDDIAFYIDDKKITRKEVSHLGEVLLEPDTNGISIAMALAQVIQQEYSLSDKVYMVGGNSSTYGFHERLTAELSQIIGNSNFTLSRPKIFKLASMVGAKKYLSLEKLLSFALFTEEYDELGPRGIHTHVQM